MAKFKFNPSSIGKVQKNLDLASAKMQRKAVFALANWAEDTIEEVQREIVKVKAFDTGDLHGSVSRTTPRRVGKSKVRVLILVNKAYASVIEFGRQARTKPPPISALVGWAKRHGMVKSLPVTLTWTTELRKKYATARAIRKNSFKVGTKRRAKQKPLDRVVRDFLVLLGLQEGIGQRGIRGRRPFGKVFDRRRKTFARDILKWL